ncbi:MAG: hypothetical protein ACI9ON_003275 [Limisphaerales bacterium]|jgi:hypothetical protein
MNKSIFTISAVIVGLSSAPVFAGNYFGDSWQADTKVSLVKPSARHPVPEDNEPCHIIFNDDGTVTYEPAGCGGSSSTNVVKPVEAVRIVTPRRLPGLTQPRVLR